MSVKSVSCQLWWMCRDIARCRPCFDQTVWGTCKSGWHTFISLTQTISISPHFLSVYCLYEYKSLWSLVEGWQGTEYEFVLVWNLHRSRSKGALYLSSDHRLLHDETDCKQIRLRWLCPGLRLVQSLNTALWLVNGLRTFTLIFSAVCCAWCIRSVGNN